MNILSRAAACAVLVCVAAAAHAQNEAECRAVKFSDELLERFPRAPESCLDVISRGGEEYAVFNVRLQQVSGNNLRVRFRHPDGSLGPSTRITAPRDFRVLVEGEPTRVQDLASNQTLKAYVHVSRPMVALEPATATAQLHVVPLVVTPAGAQAAAGEADDRTRLAEASGDPRMPDTAGPVPIFATMGVLFACAALGMRAVRGARSLRRRRIARLTPA